VLGRLGDARALSAALERLTVPDAETRGAALDAAERLLSPKDADGRAVEPLARALSARAVSRAERLRLVGLLGRTGSERALPALLPLLESRTDPQLSESAAAALGSIPGAAAGRALLSALAAEDPRIKRAAALSIRQNADAALLAALLSRLERGGRRDRELAYLALPGPLGRSADDALVARAAKLVATTRGGERDDLLEALSASSRAPARSALSAVARSADAADRAKVAELLSAYGDSAALVALSRDADARVRQNAVWSLGFVSASGAGAARSALQAALKDRDAAVVGNAAVALGRLARGDGSVRSLLCGALLDDARASVREQSLRGLLLAGVSCEGGKPQQLLSRDPHARMRRAAAELLQRAAPGPAERRLLQRCEDNDTHAVVAETCASPARVAASESEPLTLLVVPSDGAEPTPGAAFSLLFADGGLRLGSADRRGGAHEPRAPQGAVELLPYAGGD